MRQETHEFSVSTRGRGLVNVNRDIVSWVKQQGMHTGLLTVFVRHTSGSAFSWTTSDAEV